MPNCSILHQNVPKMLGGFMSDFWIFAVGTMWTKKEVDQNAVPKSTRENRLGKGPGGVLERIVVLDAPAAGLWGAWLDPTSWTNRRAN
jgi:hypothetical protein